MGRPSDFTQELADVICERIADGESLRAICTDDNMPSTSTVCRWLAKDREFQEQYAHARELQADALFDDCLAIADGTTLKAKEDVQDRRLQMEEDDYAMQKKRRENLERILVFLLGSDAFRPGAGIAANPYTGGEN